ncbi:Kelch repeat-containing protein [Pseudozobellia thermophila]|uniref:Kelch motif-containing protein n=1 Tax=Pseudozobellia thermophila TaxID=192903 RepID=A0A1M6BAW8_9FLAO|nr:kelch repeat-containing protein [Pseudozobellia thermophila]SHI45836.1 Kelch motif-containing protein [Pseudozobellia thermophila]
MARYLTLVCLALLFGNCKDTAKTEKKETVKTHEAPVSLGWQEVVAQGGSKPVARHEAAFVRVGPKFYLLGGRGIRPVSIYDTQTKEWTEGQKPPIELHHFQPVVFEDKIYVIAALTGKWPGETPTEYVYIYDPASDKWSKGDVIPPDRRRGSTGNVLYNGKIYIACGIKNGHIGDHKNWMDSYDPKTGQWQVLTDAPRARDHFQAVLAEGKIYAPAGRNTGIEPDDPFGGTLAEVDVYDIESDSWQTLSEPIPTQRAGNAAMRHNDEIWVVGGESPTQEKAHADVEALDLSTMQWRKLPGLIEGRHGTGLVFFEDDVYIASGCGKRGGEPELTTMEKYGELP